MIREAQPQASGHTRSSIGRGIHLWRLSLAIAVSELDQRYRRTMIGKNWIALTFLVFVAVKVFIFGALNNQPLSFFAPYLAVGFLLFRFITLAVTGGANVFISSQNWIKTEPLPLTLYLLTLLWKSFIMLAYMAIPTIAVCLWVGSYSWLVMASIPAVLLLYAINHLWISCLLGIIAARYRDVVYLLTTVMQVLYFATPILWVPTQEGVRAWVALYNPLTHYIAVMRDPIVYGTIPWNSWTIVALITLVGCVLAVWSFQSYKNKLVYWI